jgi:hypothetical protein
MNEKRESKPLISAKTRKQSPWEWKGGPGEWGLRGNFFRRTRSLGRVSSAEWFGRAVDDEAPLFQSTQRNEVGLVADGLVRNREIVEQSSHMFGQSLADCPPFDSYPLQEEKVGKIRVAESPSQTRRLPLP